MRILGLSIQVWLLVIAAFCAIAYAIKRGKKLSKIVAGILGVIALFAVLLQISVSIEKAKNTSSEYDELLNEIVSKQDVDVDELVEVLELAVEDIEKYELTDEKLAYMKAVSNYTSLISSTTATQSDIDAAIEDLARLRSDMIASQKTTQVVDDYSNDLTVSQKNALSEARSYLSFSAFSYEGLIEQLEYEKFSHDDAVYAADNCGADWNAQALAFAKDYLDYTAFSYSGLIKQLEYEKFTHEQAVYGADNCGANWYEEAAECAQDYMDYSAFSRGGLIDQLLFEGFTQEQAEYGATSVGL